MSSIMEEEAKRQVQQMQREYMQYRLTMPPKFLEGGVPVIRKSDDWIIHHDTLNGVFYLDEPLARKLAAHASSSSEDSWLTEYLQYTPSGNDGFGGYLKDSTYGSGNILGSSG